MLRTFLTCCFVCSLCTAAQAAEWLPNEAAPLKSNLLAQNQAKPKADAAKPKVDATKAEAKPAPLNAESETAVLEFVREHHAELAGLLENLKDSRPKEYQKAVRDLTRVRERLAQYKKNNQPRYDLELAMWKAESRTQLLAARLQMNDSSELREQLQASLNDQYDRKLAILKFERDMHQERLNKANEQLQKTDAERSQMIERQMQVLLKSSPTKPAANKPVKTDKQPAEPAVKEKPAKTSSPPPPQKP